MVRIILLAIVISLTVGAVPALAEKTIKCCAKNSVAQNIALGATRLAMGLELHGCLRAEVHSGAL